MVLLEKLWDDVVAGPQPERGLGMLRRITTQPLNTNEGGAVGTKDQGWVSTPTTPVTPITPGFSGRKDNVWRSVFQPGSNLNTRGIGAAVFDKPTQPNSPTVYDWLYSGESRSQHR